MPTETTTTQSGKEAKNLIPLEKRQEIANRLAGYYKETGFSYEKIASELYGDAAIKTNVGNAISGKWAQIGDDTWRKLETGLNKYYNTGAFVWHIVDTKGNASVRKMCEDCQKFQKMAMLCGYSGNGKTETLQIYTLSNKKKGNVFMVTCKTTDTRKKFLAKILNQLGYASFKGDVGDMLVKIEEVLGKIDKPFLIIDEAGSLKESMIVMLKDLYNTLNGKIGILLAGVGYAYSTLVKLTKEERMGYPELFSRIQYKYNMPKINKSEAVQICEVNGMDNKHGAVDWLWDHCRINGNFDLRKMRGIVTTAVSEWGNAVSSQQLEDAFGINHSFNLG